MKRTVEETAETRKLIVSTAAREFRKNGEQVGLADIMKAAGLTHGGFYRHFDSKETLFAEATAFALNKLADKLEQALASTSTNQLETVINVYLSTSHRDNVGGGCPLAAMGGEIARASKKSRAELIDGYNRIVELISGCLTKSTARSRRADAEFILASMTGALTMSRVISDKDVSAAMLQECASRLAKVYA